mmetsp:Transcript_31285/g.76950  ORF Transcript_31285/g.76950 Transcript_31285/m.76950 type:complete len:205 (-) Transcript_31285:268-882(-)
MSVDALTPTEQPRRPRQDKHIKDPVRYKTVLCNKFESLGKCPYGPRCQFSHGEAELRERRAAKAASAADTGSSSADAVAPPAAPTRNGSALPTVPEVPVSPPMKPIAEPETPPSTPRLTQASPVPPNLALPLAALADSSGGSGTCELCEDVGLSDIGEVICRKDASHNTMSVRRAISFLFDADEKAEVSLDLQGPFGFPTVPAV